MLCVQTLDASLCVINAILGICWLFGRICGVLISWTQQAPDRFVCRESGGDKRPCSGGYPSDTTQDGGKERLRSLRGVFLSNSQIG